MPASSCFHCPSYLQRCSPGCWRCSNSGNLQFCRPDTPPDFHRASGFNADLFPVHLPEHASCLDHCLSDYRNSLPSRHLETETDRFLTYKYKPAKQLSGLDRQQICGRICSCQHYQSFFDQVHLKKIPLDFHIKKLTVRFLMTPVRSANRSAGFLPFTNTASQGFYTAPASEQPPDTPPHKTAQGSTRAAEATKHWQHVLPKLTCPQMSFIKTVSTTSPADHPV